MLNENEVFDRIRCITGPDEGFGYEEGDNETLFVIQETSIKNRYKFFVIDKDLNYVKLIVTSELDQEKTFDKMKEQLTLKLSPFIYNGLITTIKEEKSGESE